MSDLTAKLSQASHRNTTLLHTLSQTEYAPPTLAQNKSYIADLTSQIKHLDVELRTLHAITEDERKDHVKYRDSIVKRFAYHRLGGSKGKEKFSSKSEKEEREFLEAWQAERAASERREELGRALSQAEAERPGLEAAAAQHEQAQTELDAMYENIFGGPTPEVAGEDQMEQAVLQARGWFEQCQIAVGANKHAYEQVQAAVQSLQLARSMMGSALDYSTWDVMGGGMMSDMMERDSLSMATMRISQAMNQLQEARRAQPEISMLSGVNVDNGHMMGDVFFDNIFSDYAQHQRIKASGEELERTFQQAQEMVKEQEQRCRDAKAQLAQAAGGLGDARRELQRIRAEAFNGLSFGQGAPPQYQAVY